MEFLGNTTNEYLMALIALAVIWFALKLVRSVILHHLEKLSKKTETDLDDTFIRAFKSVKPAFYNFLALYLALLFLDLPEGINYWIDVLFLIFVVYQVIKIIQALVDYLIEKRTERDNRDAESAFKFLGNLFKWSLWLVGIILILSNLGINVSSLIAGLGIGGIAVAMAVQGILSDLFSAFSIYFDKPFVVGDTIKVGNSVGTVEKIGIKTTRLRSLENNEELVVPNQELTSTFIQNFRTITKRRVALKFGVVYDTDNKKLKKIPEIVKKTIDGVSKARFDRSHFTNFGSSSLDFETIYFIESGDYNEYMDAQQKINLELKGAFEKEGIEMAYPTQTLHIQK